MQVTVNWKVVKKAETKIRHSRPVWMQGWQSGLSLFPCLTVCLSVTHTHTQLSLWSLPSCFLDQPAALLFQARITSTHADHNRMRASVTQFFYQSSPDKLSWDCPGTFACPWTCCCAQKIEIAPSCLWDSFSLLKPGALVVLWIEWSVIKEEGAACWTNKAKKSLYM